MIRRHGNDSPRPRLSRRPPRGRRLIAITACALLVTGCSIGAEDSPRTWSDWSQFEESAVGSTAGEERIYLIGNRFNGDSDPVLRPVSRILRNDLSGYQGTLELLLRGPTSDEASQGLGTKIPSGVKVLARPRVESTTVVFDLSQELTSALGDDLVDALAQIVWTIWERSSERQVQILVEGESIALPRADGSLVTRPLTPFDYPGYVETSQSDFPGVIRP